VINFVDDCVGDADGDCDGDGGNDCRRWQCSEMEMYESENTITINSFRTRNVCLQRTAVASKGYCAHAPVSVEVGALEVQPRVVES